MDIKVDLATEEDKEQLIDYFKHYKNKNLIENRIKTYLSYGFTIIAKDKNKVVGVLQWYVKENPNSGVAEFEEVHVIDSYRKKGIGPLLIKKGIENVREFFNNNDIKPRKIFLLVSEKNQAARKLYEKLGFKFVAKLNELFSEGNIEAFYCLDLQTKN